MKTNSQGRILSTRPFRAEVALGFGWGRGCALSGVQRELFGMVF